MRNCIIFFSKLPWKIKLFSHKTSWGNLELFWANVSLFSESYPKIYIYFLVSKLPNNIYLSIIVLGGIVVGRLCHHKIRYNLDKYYKCQMKSNFLPQNKIDTMKIICILSQKIHYKIDQKINYKRRPIWTSLGLISQRWLSLFEKDFW